MMLIGAAITLGAGMASAGPQPPIALVKNTAARETAPSEARGAEQFYQTMAGFLDKAGARYAELTDEDIATGGLAGYRLAIFPYSPAIPDEVAAWMVEFIEAGGKVFIFYTVPQAVAEALGMRVGEYRRAQEGEFAACRFLRDGPAGLPERILQDSWNIYRAEASRADAKVIARWETKEGRDTGIPAIIISNSGGYMGHVLTNVDVARKTRMLLALVGHLLPEVLEGVGRHRVATLGRVGEVGRLSALRQMVREAEDEGRARGAGEHVRELTRLASGARRALRAGDVFQALALADEAGRQAVYAYALIQPTRGYELRAAWIHTAYGVADWGWDRTIKVLADNGFNAIFPNMLWAGLAHYPSEVLPLAPEVAEKGDQIAEAVKACRKYGVELHVWKVNHNLLHAPAEFMDRLRAEGRLQRSAEGEEVPWLCPSHPDNFALERDSMLEVVRKYPVDGIHFDYIRYPGSGACSARGVGSGSSVTRE